MPAVTESKEVRSLKTQTRRTLDHVREQLEQARSQVAALESEAQQLETALKALGDDGGSSGRRRAAATAAASSTRRQSTTTRRRRRTTTRRRPRTQAAKGEREKEMLDLLSKGEFTRAELAEKMGLSKVRIQQLLNPLAEQGRVVSRRDPSSQRPRMLWRAKGTKTSVTAPKSDGSAATQSTRRRSRSRSRAKAKS